MTETIEEQKESLINLIKWYRDKYHKQDFGHTEMIASVVKASTQEQLEPIAQTVDSWLDS